MVIKFTLLKDSCECDWAILLLCLSLESDVDRTNSVFKFLILQLILKLLDQFKLGSIASVFIVYRFVYHVLSE